ncbi:MAG: release factor glutamine methyltransferase [Verrucomicrobiales bacterium]|jgi:release factor glutamine methyltransferase
MTTILDALQKGTDYFEKHGVESARLNMQHLLAHVRRCDRMALYTSFDDQLYEDELEKLRELMRSRVSGKPLQHLVGTVDFLEHEFKTDARALIPRPETEELAALLLEMDWAESVRVLDVGCGSGVLGLSLAAGLEEDSETVAVTLADISPDALALAQENAEKLGLLPENSSLQFLESDLFSAIEGEFDLIVANLPYISQADMATLSAEVKHDPELALVGGPSGTEIMEKFLAGLPEFLAPDGLAALEFGLGQEQLLEACAQRIGFNETEIVKDITERARFLLVRNGSE